MAWRADLERRDLAEGQSVSSECRSQGRHVAEAGVPVRRLRDTWSDVCVTVWARRRWRRGGTGGGAACHAPTVVVVVVVVYSSSTPLVRSSSVGRVAAAVYHFEAQKQVSNV